MATYEEAIKRAYASCPSNVPVLQAIQVSHSSLPNGDMWFVDRLLPYTLTLEDGNSESACGLDPGAPGDAPPNPSPVSDPGSAPTSPYEEPLITQYIYYDSEGNPKSYYPFGPNKFTIIDSTTWDDIYESYAEGLSTQADVIPYAEAVYVLDHDAWQAISDTYDAWVEDKALYDAYVAAHALYNDWVARDTAHTAWLACVEAENITQVFQPLAYEIKLAASGENGIQDISINGCDVERQFEEFFENVALSGSLERIMLTYRAYREDDLTTVGYWVKMSLSDGRFTVHGFSARATVGDFVNKQYLGATFTEAEFPGLASRG